MAIERIVVPGVYVNEIDNTVNTTGTTVGPHAAIIGSFQSGPAFIPTLISSRNELLQRFGGVSPLRYAPYAANYYLENAANVTVVRVMHDEGYNLSGGSVYGMYIGAATTARAATSSIDVRSFDIGVGHGKGDYLRYYNPLIDKNWFFIATGSSTLVSDYAHRRYYFQSSSAVATPTSLQSRINAAYMDALSDGVDIGFTSTSVYSSGGHYILKVTASVADNEHNALHWYSGSHDDGFSDSGSAQIDIHPVSTKFKSIVKRFYGGRDSLADKALAMVIAPTTSPFNYAISASGTYSGPFHIYVTASGGTIVSSYSCSLNPSASGYIANVLGTSPQSSMPIYVLQHYPNVINMAAQTSVALAKAPVKVNCTYPDRNYRNASTPWVVSQQFGGTYYNLFKLHTISDGTDANKAVKVALYNINHADESQGRNYGQFGMAIRAWDDTDRHPVVLETYSLLDLDPTSVNYIGRRIGDKYSRYEQDNDGEYCLNSYGDYDNKSLYVRIEMSDDVRMNNIPATAIPFGFSALYVPISGSGATWNVNDVPTGSIKTNQIDPLSKESNPDKIYMGADYSRTELLQYLSPLPASPSAGSNRQFNLESMVYSASAHIAPTSAVDLKYRKFIVPFQGGFDGVNPAASANLGKDITAANLMGFDCRTNTSPGTDVWKRAIDLLSEKQDHNIDVLFMPGVDANYGQKVVQYAQDMCETRGDCALLIDIDRQGSQPADAAALGLSINSSFVAAYYPWLRISDTVNNKFAWVPPSVGIAQVIAYNDRKGYKWSAPAGLSRGQLSAYPETNISNKQLESLYENGVNPIVSSTEGQSVWGNKTLLHEDSQLNRLGTRRLVIAIKKQINEIARYFVFEQNVASNRDKLLNQIRPYLDSVVRLGGLTKYEIISDDSNNTAAMIANHIMQIDIRIMAPGAAEYVVVDVNITRDSINVG